ncbi:MAG TPA: helix-turn-helix domain-containing protein [Ktedonobacteraceae bacterium]|nr:helix-turn-helix domain-containing protein [Ktedonobacteraceae bacterium]
MALLTPTRSVATPLDNQILTFKEAMSYLRVSRSTLYRLMWSGQLTGHKVGSAWRFYREDLSASVQMVSIAVPATQTDSVPGSYGLADAIAASN